MPSRLEPLAESIVERFCELAGRNASERRASLENGDAGADWLEVPGRPKIGGMEERRRPWDPPG